MVAEELYFLFEENVKLRIEYWLWNIAPLPTPNPFQILLIFESLA